MKVLLINLPREGEAVDYTTSDYILTDFSKYPPLGLMAIGTGLDRKRHEVALLDANVRALSIADTVDRIEAARPDVLGLSVVTRRLYAMREIAREVKRRLPRTAIVAGGPHVNYWPAQTMALGPVDYCLPGFAEETFPQLVEALTEARDVRGIPDLYYREHAMVRHTRPVRSTGKTLDHLPFPDRTLVNLDDYYTAVDMARMTTAYSSRGCPFHCTFCDVQEKRWLYRTPANLVDEFAYLQGLGIGEVHVFDDVFNIRQDRVLAICDEILRRKLRIRWSIRARVNPWRRDVLERLKQAGCHRIHVGVESLDPATLEYMNKQQSKQDIETFFRDCNEIGLETLAYLIIGFPTESRRYRERFYDEIMALRPTYAFVNILFPLAKTQYYEALVRDGTYARDHWADYLAAPTPHFEIPLPRPVAEQRELEDLADAFHRRFCYRLGFLCKELWRSAKYPKMLARKAWLALVLARDAVLWRRPRAHARYVGSDGARTVHGLGA